ncbi:1-deoxy-D-xylulose-5-phosphate reductoisomerase [Natronoflexus pectinivorans]|uniref:1-deoxy-D-xylulose 5-phosphate reductoisomerase n=1 Tax=Natronoflexus pectinivorans TaxID=682526 RepID=A0A4V2RWE1_9BACT|nr:1-deoxy-D-xylulose-5-phosphate reductoisomerase [Natronoflexus pectinivorans]TCO07984.1 1-deoxy-D-xylulose 5-phosphate reductoisomerase [Natronoflexus pectinivorans]
MQKRLAILGSTGSIGTQALEVIKTHPELFSIEVLTANNNVELLAKQAKEYQPNVVVIGNKEKYDELKEALSNEPIKIYAGEQAIEQVAAMSTIDMVLTSMVGFSGLLPTIRAVEAGIPVALANKETLVVAGDLIMELAAKKQIPVIPVDSEHSAIFQCLQGEKGNIIEKIMLTASGGPFRGKSVDFLKKVTKCQALNHPNWKMGDKITIDSASLMNKGLEAIEARWLFNLQPDQIEIVVHPQSIIHSMVQFTDGSIKAQMGLPDMRLPIQYAMAYPRRIENSFPRFNFSDYPSLTFEKADVHVFKNLSLAFEAMRQGGNAPCVLNAANEIVVDAFLRGRTGFLEMSHIIEKTIEKSTFIDKPMFQDYLETDAEARRIATEMIK